MRGAVQRPGQNRQEPRLWNVFGFEGPLEGRPLETHGGSRRRETGKSKLQNLEQGSLLGLAGDNLALFQTTSKNRLASTFRSRSPFELDDDEDHLVAVACHALQRMLEKEHQHTHSSHTPIES